MNWLNFLNFQNMDLLIQRAKNKIRKKRLKLTTLSISKLCLVEGLLKVFVPSVRLLFQINGVSVNYCTSKKSRFRSVLLCAVNF